MSEARTNQRTFGVVVFVIIFALMLAHIVFFRWLPSEDVRALFRQPTGVVLNLTAIGFLLAFARKPRLGIVHQKLGEFGKVVNDVERLCALVFAIFLAIATVIVLRSD